LELQPICEEFGNDEILRLDPTDAVDLPSIDDEALATACQGLKEGIGSPLSIHRREEEEDRDSSKTARTTKTA